MFIANQTKQKECLFRRMKANLRAAGCWFLNDLKGQKVAQVTCFENILRIRRFFSADV